HVSLALRDVGPALLQRVIGEDEVAGEGVADSGSARGEEVPIPPVRDTDDELRIVVAVREAGLTQGRRRNAAANERCSVLRGQRGFVLERVASVRAVAVDLGPA